MIDTAFEDLIGRLFLIGFEGEEFSPELEALLLEIRPGGIILFKRNVSGGPAAVSRLTTACRNLARSEWGRDLLVAVDEEGGPVRRLGPPFTQKPGQREMAGTMTPDQVGRLCETCGRELAAVGINFNLAPVLDLAVDPEASFMAERSFGPDPDIAAGYGLAVIEAHRRQGVLTCAKHFPGIGDTRLDPHEDLPTVGHPAERLLGLEIKPFEAAAEAGVAAMMTSHINYPGLDDSAPATFSRRINIGLLRERVGFNGLILCDDLEMGAIVRHYRIGPAAVETLRAGSDLVLVCRQPEYIREARRAVVDAVRSGNLPLAGVEESAGRVMDALNRVSNPPREALDKLFSDIS